MSVSRITRAGVLRLLTSAVLLLPLGAVSATASAHAPAATRTVVYRGLTLRVPAAWPVVSLRAHPSTCVRFDRHAVYLGVPGRAQVCPPAAIGRTEAILVSPSAPGTDAPSGAITVHRHGLSITATFDHRPQLIVRALRLRGQPAPAAAPPIRLAADARRRARAAGGRIAHAATTGYSGLAFDTCSAPSASAIAAWAASPYRGIGVYIGGINSACAQENLTAAWVSQAVAAGWHLILTYVGRQAPHNVCGCASIAPAHASAEGAAAADDAVARATALGIGPGAPIDFDMESYPTTAVNRGAVLAFLAAWTDELHRLGYRSGVYSSTSSGIADLVGADGTGYAEPDELWFADWNGQPTTETASIPASEWADHQRLHQYLGDHRARYGGVTLDIDSDFVDAATAGATGTVTAPAAATVAAPTPVRATPGRRRPTHRPAPAPAPAPATGPLTEGELVEVAGTGSVYRIVGGAPLFVHYWDDIGGPAAATRITAAQFDTLRAVPADGSVVRTDDGAVYVIAGGYPFALASPPAGHAATLVDIWDIENLGSPLSHLNATPADGTIVTGEPSGAAWIFESGALNPAPSTAGATPVSDASLTVWPAAEPPFSPGSAAAGPASTAGTAAAGTAAAGTAGAGTDASASGITGWPSGGNWSWPG